jgi:hypothetical protein
VSGGDRTRPRRHQYYQGSSWAAVASRQDLGRVVQGRKSARRLRGHVVHVPRDTFRARAARDRNGNVFTAFLPAISKDALPAHDPRVALRRTPRANRTLVARNRLRLRRGAARRRQPRSLTVFRHVRRTCHPTDPFSGQGRRGGLPFGSRCPGKCGDQPFRGSSTSTGPPVWRTKPGSATAPP